MARATRVTWVAWALVAAALVGCGGPTVGPTPGGGGGGAQGGGENTTPVDPASAAAGRTVFERACGSCHAAGADAGRTAPDLAGRNLTEAQVNQQIHAGTDTQAVMPAIPPALLPASDIPPLLVYLRSIRAMR